MARVCTLIVNPVSGGYSEHKLRQVLAAIAAGGLTPEVLFTRSAEDAESFSREICEKNDEPFIVAGGGDGTVNGVVNGLVQGKATLAVLPLGTANVLAKELGIESLADAAERIVRGKTRPLAVGLLEKGEWRRRFILMAGIGVDGAIVQGVRNSEKRILGKGAYLLSAVRRLANWEGDLLEVTAGDCCVTCHSVVICNASRYGGGFLIAPEADLFAPEFLVLCMVSNRRRAYLRLALAIIRGRVNKNSDIAWLTADQVTIRGEKAVQLDGDYCCHAPLRITSLEGVARLVI